MRYLDLVPYHHQPPISVQQGLSKTSTALASKTLKADIISRFSLVIYSSFTSYCIYTREGRGASSLSAHYDYSLY